MNTKKLKEEIEKRNKKHREEAKRLNIQPLNDNGWDDTIKLESQLKARQQAFKDVESVLNKFFIKKKFNLDSMIKNRINSEFKKFCVSDVDWLLTSAIKIRKTIEEKLKAKLRKMK